MIRQISESSDKAATCNHRMKTRKRIALIVTYFFMCLFALFFIFPFLYMVLTSFMTEKEVTTLPVRLFPTSFYLGAYKASLSPQLFRYLLNTIIVLAVNLVAVPLASVFCAYGFTKVQFQGRNLIFAVLLSTMMLPAAVTQIPLYIMYVGLGWLNTLLPLTVPAVFGGGIVNIFLCKQYMRGLPNAMNEAARIDGANHFQIFINLIVPLCMPVVVLILVNTFLSCWNDFMGPLIFLRSEKVWTLAVGIYMQFKGDYNVNNYPNIQMATSTLLSIPGIILFFIFQNQLMEGVVMGSVKG